MGRAVAPYADGGACCEAPMLRGFADMFANRHEACGAMRAADAARADAWWVLALLTADD